MTTTQDPAGNLARLIRCPSVTPEDAGAIAALASMLEPMGFECHRVVFTDADTPDIANLFAVRRGAGPHLTFAGHTDVVPTGPVERWTHDPFAADIADGFMFGRGAVDMKGGIACFVAALARLDAAGGWPAGSISLLVTGDEEGPAVNGTEKLLAWAHERGERFDAALVGEPTNPDRLGAMVKIGRRGSLSGLVTVKGRQGHVAYPHLADNPARGIVTLCDALMREPYDAGSAAFPPSTMEVTSIDIANRAANVIAGEARAVFNIRFSDRWTPDTLKAEIAARLDRAARASPLREAGRGPVDYELVWRERPSDSFLTRDDALIDTLSRSIASVTGLTPELSTTGGTSDARFIKDYCPVVEFGLVGQTMHMVDERVALADLETLTTIYVRVIEGWFAAQAQG